jgi:hypothetical protein
MPDVPLCLKVNCLGACSGVRGASLIAIHTPQLRIYRRTMSPRQRGGQLVRKQPDEDQWIAKLPSSIANNVKVKDWLHYTSIFR